MGQALYVASFILRILELLDFLKFLQAYMILNFAYKLIFGNKS
jgi:hypothetical protein